MHTGCVADSLTDRKLNHVNKKGRPVSQCQHCRGLRKVRASHVKCDCGEQGSKNITLEDEVSAGMSCDDPILNFTDSLSDEASCHCMAGTKCTCALKRELSDAEDVLAPLQRSASHGKPIIHTHRSESAVHRLRTNSQHHYHPPLHRLNHAAHEHGQPYTLPRSRPMSSGSDATSEEHVIENYSSAQYSEGQQQQIKHRSTSPLSQELSFSGESMPTPRSRPRPPPVQTAEPKLPYPNLAVPADSPFLYSALSPANPHRYSLNDFSMFTLDNFQAQDMSTREVITPQEALDRGDSTWPAWDDVGTFDFDVNDPMFAQVGIAPSEQSVDHITSGPLSRSTSGTTSEAEEMSAARSDFSFDPNAFAAGMPVGWEMPNLIPDLTTDAFDADFGSYIDVSSDAPALLPTENMAMNLAAQPTLGMPNSVQQQQQQQQQQQSLSLSQAQLQQSINMTAQMSANAYPSSSNTAGYLTQAQSSYKDEEVRQWLTQDPTTDQDQVGPLEMGLENCYADAGGLDFAAQDFGMQQVAQGQGQVGVGGVSGVGGLQQQQQQMEGQFPGEPTWF